MSIKKVLKIAGICGIVYAASEVSFQYGKGFMLRQMEKHDLTAEETRILIKESINVMPIKQRINLNIIKFAAAPDDK